MKKFLSLLAVALLSTTAWAATTVTIDFTAQGYSNAEEVSSLTVDGVTVTLDKGSNNNTPKYYNTGAALRLYGGSTLTLTSTEGNITSAVFTFSGTGYTMNNTAESSVDAGTYAEDGTTGTWTGDVSEFTITRGGTSGHARIKTIEVTLAEGDTPEPAAVAAPEFNPNGGEFDVTSLAVTVSCATENASIYLYKVVDGEIDYTTQQYFFQSGEFYVTETSTYTAYAYKGEDMSEYTTVTFTKVVPTVATPTFDPVSGTTFTDELDVTISCATPGAIIMYSYGDVVEEALAPVTITLTEDATISAVASLEGYADSEEATATYTKVEPTPAGTIIFNPGDYEAKTGEAWSITKDGVTIASSNGTITTDQYRFFKGSTATITSTMGSITKIEFTCTASGSEKYGPGCFTTESGNYAVDGTVGTWTGNATSVVFTASSNQVRATQIIVYIDGEMPEVLAPEFTPATGTIFTGTQEVTITCETEGAAIYYSINDGEYALYENPFTISETATIKAYAELNDVQSSITSVTYTRRTEVDNIAQANALDAKTYFVYNGEAVVTYQNGSSLWIRDNSGSGLIFGNQVPAMEQGTVLSDGWDAQKTVYKSIPEFQYPNNVTASGDVVTVEPTERETITTDNVNEYVVLRGINVLAQLDSVGNYTKNFYNAADSLALFNQFGVEMPVIDESKKYDVVGVVTIYNTNPEVYIISVTEVEEETWQLGDVNHDTKVDVSDVTALIAYILGNQPEVFFIEQANVNGDEEGKIDVSDVTALIAKILGN